ncbi:hypothetical protein P7C70_g7978, partial [Phenoliferia sp. Uapishka_3]
MSATPTTLFTTETPPLRNTNMPSQDERTIATRQVLESGWVRPNVMQTRAYHNPQPGGGVDLILPTTLADQRAVSIRNTPATAGDNKRIIWTTRCFGLSLAGPGATTRPLRKGSKEATIRGLLVKEEIKGGIMLGFYGSNTLVHVEVLIIDVENASNYNLFDLFFIRRASLIVSPEIFRNATQAILLLAEYSQARLRVISTIGPGPGDDVAMSFANGAGLGITNTQAWMGTPGSPGKSSSHSDADSEKLKAKFQRWKTGSNNFGSQGLPSITMTPATPIAPSTTPTTQYLAVPLPTTPSNKQKSTDPRRERPVVPTFINTTAADYAVIAKPTSAPSPPLAPFVTSSPPSSPLGVHATTVRPFLVPNDNEASSSSSRRAPEFWMTAEAGAFDFTYDLSIQGIGGANKTASNAVKAAHSRAQSLPPQATAAAAANVKIYAGGHWRSPVGPPLDSSRGSFTSTPNQPHPPRRTNTNNRHAPYPPPRATYETPRPLPSHTYPAHGTIGNKTFKSRLPPASEERRRTLALVTEKATLERMLQAARKETQNLLDAEERRKFLESGTIVAKDRNAAFYPVVVPSGPSATPANSFASSSTTRSSSFSGPSFTNPGGHSSASHANSSNLVPSTLATGFGGYKPFPRSAFESLPNITVTANNTLHLETPAAAPNNTEQVDKKPFASLANNSFHALQHEVDDANSFGDMEEGEVDEKPMAVDDDNTYSSAAATTNVDDGLGNEWLSAGKSGRLGRRAARKNREESAPTRRNTKTNAINTKMEVDTNGAIGEAPDYELDSAIETLTKALRQRKLEHQWLKTREYRALKALEKKERQEEDRRWELAREENKNLRTREDRRRFLLGIL